MIRTSEIESQAAYHRDLFSALYQWNTFWQQTLDLTGDEESAAAMGLDQLGHFGPRGVSLVVDRLVANSDSPLSRIVELGSGYGGALRQVSRAIRSRGLHPWLVGIELVPEHCELALTIGRTLADRDVLIVQADVRRLPFPSASIDAVFAAGSASHFSSIAEVLRECGRVLRPGGLLAMTEEVSLHPEDGPPPERVFLQHHPPDVFCAASPEQRRAELEAAGLTIEVFDSLVDWAAPLLRQRVQLLRLMGHCAARMFGAEAHQRMIEAMTSAADEYERGSIQPALILARRAHV